MVVRPAGSGSQLKFGDRAELRRSLRSEGGALKDVIGVWVGPTGAPCSPDVGHTRILRSTTIRGSWAGA